MMRVHANAKLGFPLLGLGLIGVFRFAPARRELLFRWPPAIGGGTAGTSASGEARASGAWLAGSLEPPRFPPSQGGPVPRSNATGRSPRRPTAVPNPSRGGPRKSSPELVADPPRLALRTT